jgi:4-amino-4-deoxy-L-arabinose transferase-like glycosyltransferase
MKMFLLALRALLIAAPIIFIGMYLVFEILRIWYPFELEWMEGAMVDHVMRILKGELLYVEPSLEFIPCIYSPLYFYLAAIVSKVIGLGFLSLRLTSVLASIGTLIVLFRLVYKETSNVLAALLTSGLFATTYKISGAWFDIGRVDSLFFLFLVCAIFLVRFKPTTQHYVLAGIFIFLSFMPDLAPV